MKVATVSRTLALTLPIELALCAGAIGVCAALAVAEYPGLAAKARGVGAFLHAASARVRVVEDMALTGDPGTVLVGRYQDSELPFRPAIMQGDGAGQVLWLCGSREPPAGWLAPGAPDERRPPSLDYAVCRPGPRP